MKKIFLLLMTLFASRLMALPASELTDEEVKNIAIEAYIYGYPLITMDTTRKVMTNTVYPENSHAPMGQFANVRKYPDASFHDVTAPNADTLYSIAWLDLAKEPYILHVPNEHGRYYLMPMLSGWTNVFEVPGSRTTGTKEAHYAITGPQWKGNLPPDVQELKSPTNMVWILGRTYSMETPEDYQIVHALQDEYTLTPLSSFGKPYTPPKGFFDPSIDMKTPVRDQVNRMEISTFFNLLAKLMKENPPAPEDAPILEKMAKIGIAPGQLFDGRYLTPAQANQLHQIPKIALDAIMAKGKKQEKTVNGWKLSLDTGIYGTDYLQRAYVAMIGLGANRPEDAVYPMTTVDSKGARLNGKKRYVLHFPKGQTPPAKGFWSLTMYNNDYFFVPNSLNRYTLSPRNNLKYNADGSLDLYIQEDHPGVDKENNWLPSPKNEFILMLRIYWPEDSLLEGTWKPPRVQQADVTHENL